MIKVIKKKNKNKKNTDKCSIVFNTLKDKGTKSEHGEVKEIVLKSAFVPQHLQIITIVPKK